MKTCKDFKFGEIVKSGGVKCRVISSSNGWLTLVPVGKCLDLTTMLDHEVKVRPAHVLKQAVCLDCTHPCDCEEWV